LVNGSAFVLCCAVLQLRESSADLEGLKQQLSMARQALTDKERQVSMLAAETERLRGRQVREDCNNEG
jgi:hypothetical protein